MKTFLPFIKFWDPRQKDATGELNICMPDDDDEEESGAYMSQYNNYLSTVNDLLLDDKGRHLFAAMDDGTLVTVNARKRVIQVRSESLGYSARSIVTLKVKISLLCSIGMRIL